MRMLQAYFRWVPVVLLFLTGSCSSSGGNHTAYSGFEQEPHDTDSPALSTAARVTGSTFLTNIREIGLFNGAGRVTCMVIDKADSNHLIAGAASGGLWVSRNRGKTWAPIDDQLPTLSIRSITQHPVQSNVYYAATYTLMLAGSSPGVYRPDIYKSTDGGNTFQLIPATAGSFSLVQKLVCSPVSSSTIYALSDHPGSAKGVYRSTDNGATFTQVFPMSGSANDLEILPNGTVLVTGGTQVFRSATGNTGSYSLSVAGLSSAGTFGSIDLAYCQSQPNTVYGITTGGTIGVGVFRSTDAGQNWVFLQSLATGLFTRTIAVKPNDPTFVFAGSVGLYLTRNSGSSFVFYGVGGVDWWSVNFDPHNPDRVFMTFDQGIVLVNLNPFNPNNNTAYVRCDTLLNCAQIYAGDYFPVGEKVIVGMQDLGTYQVYTGGERSVGSGDGGYCYYHKQDTTIAYGSYQNGDIFIKTKAHIPFPQPGFTQPVSILNQLDADADGDVDEGAFFIQAYWVNSADGEQLYYPTKRRLWRSINGGTNWTPVSGYYNIAGPGSVETFMDGNGTNNPIIYWSVMDTLYIKPSAKTAGPGNELKVKLPGNIRWVRVDPSNDSIVYITAYSNTTGARIYRSGNLFKAGVTWTDLTGDFPAGIAVRCVEVNPQNKSQLLAGSASGLFASADGGLHWTKETQFPNVNILRTIIRPSDRRVFIFTYGRGAWSAAFPTTSSIAGNTPGTEVLMVRPNPTKGMIHVDLGESHYRGSLQIWSGDGRLKRRIPTEGQKTLAVDMGEFAPGIYIVALYEGGKRVSAARVVKN